MVSRNHEDDEFGRIIREIDLEVPAEYTERMALLNHEQRTGVIDSKQHFLTIVMDHDDETGIQKWRFLSRMPPESVREILEKLLHDWQSRD